MVFFELHFSMESNFSVLLSEPSNNLFAYLIKIRLKLTLSIKIIELI